MDNTLDAATDTMEGRLRFPNPDGVLTPGLFAKVQILGSGEYEALLIPDEAVSLAQNRTTVLVLAMKSEADGDGGRGRRRPGPAAGGAGRTDGGAAAGRTRAAAGRLAGRAERALRRRPGGDPRVAGGGAGRGGDGAGGGVRVRRRRPSRQAVRLDLAHAARPGNVGGAEEARENEPAGAATATLPGRPAGVGRRSRPATRTVPAAEDGEPVAAAGGVAAP